ncbi:MAG: FkbM family methyltransferase, partial [Elusimicrobia bacterium]
LVFLPVLAVVVAAALIYWVGGWSHPLRSRTLDGFMMEGRFPEGLQSWIYLFGVWEPDVAALLREGLSPGDVFVDVGANVGYFTILASRLVGPSGAVVAVEPSPEMARRLRSNLAANPGSENVRHVAAAAGSAEGNAWIHLGPAVGEGHTSLIPGLGFTPEAEVRVAPLGDLLRPEEAARARLVKVDVEGWEAEVVAGLPALLDVLPEEAELLFEVCPRRWPAPRPSLAEAFEPLISRGYKPLVVENDYSPWRYLWPHKTTPPSPVAWPIDPGLADVSVLFSKRAR